MTLQTLILRYAAFAVVASIANLAVQRVMLGVLLGPNAIFVAMLAGAVVGIIIKYSLDRKFIFAPAQAATMGEFLCYAATGAILTGLFFVSEYGLWRLFESDLAREAGAVIGLAIGYITKYKLDRAFIFADPPPTPANKMR